MAVRVEYRDAAGDVVHVPVSGARTVIEAAPGLEYRLVADEPGAPADRLTVRRVGDGLLVEGLPAAAVVEFDGFFSNCTVEQPCSLVLGAFGAPAAEAITPASVPLAALPDDSFVMYAAPAATAGLTPPPEHEPAFSGKSLGLGIGLLALAGAGGGGGADAAASADSVAPAAPLFATPKETAEATPTLAGSAEPGARVVVTLGTAAGEVVATWQTVSDAGGSWRIDTAVEPPLNSTALFDGGLPEGTLTLLGRAIDGAGNISELATAQMLVDRAAPDGTIALVRVLDDFGPVIGAVGVGAATDDAQPTLEGTLSRPLAAGEHVVVYRDGTVLGDAELSDADWSFTEPGPIVAGPHQYQARVETADGLRVAVSNAYRIVLDDQPPAAPTLATVAGDDRVDAAERAAGVLVSGLADPLSSVTVDWGGVRHSGIADATGAWQVRFESAELPGNGSYTVQAIAYDAAGNASAAAAREVLVSVAPPMAPTIDRIFDDAGTRTGALSRNQSSDDDRPRIDGHFASALAPGEVLHIERNGVDVGAADSGRLVFDGHGGWSYTDSALPSDGSWRYTAHVVDAAGQSSSASASFAFVLDREPPDAPSIDRVAGNDRVSSTEARRTLIITGDAEPNASVHVDWGDAARVVDAGANGHWAADFTGAIPPYGRYPVSAWAEDAAGNAGPTQTRNVRVDTVLFGVGDEGSAVLKASDLFVSSQDDSAHAASPLEPVGPLLLAPLPPYELFA